jgi:hypothetical protein
MSMNNPRWLPIDAVLQHFEVDELRKFFGAAIKFLIQCEHWDDRHPASIFDAEPVISRYHEGFDTFFSAEMRGEADLPNEDKALLSILRRAANPPSRRSSRRTVKRKSTQLRKEIQKRFLRYFPQLPGSVRGLRFYEGLIRSTYINR